MRDVTCPVPGCTNTGDEHHTVCRMHRSRMTRTGTYDPRPPTTFPPTQAENGYLRISIPKTHPLAGRSTTRTWMHRVVLFDKIGFGPHRCHWCARHVNWRAGLLVDHLDDDRQNNAPDNLVPSCNGCNIRRAFAHP